MPDRVMSTPQAMKRLRKMGLLSRKEAKALKRLFRTGGSIPDSHPLLPALLSPHLMQCGAANRLPL